MSIETNRVGDTAARITEAQRTETAARAPDGGFDASVRGAQPKPGFDRAMADVAGAAYDPARQQASGWRRMGDGELARAGIDANLQYRDGMLAGVYTDGKGHYTVAYAGNNTNGPEDIGTVVGQSAGLQTKQVNNAVALARQVEGAYGGDNVVYTGHSLGGMLASMAAADTGSTAVTFNSAGVHDNTMRQFGMDPAATRVAAANGQMRTYGMDGDWATAIQRDIPFVDALPDPLGSDLRMTNPEGISNLANAHNLGPIIDSFDRGLAIRQGSNQPDPFEQATQNFYNVVTGFARFLPFPV